MLGLPEHLFVSPGNFSFILWTLEDVYVDRNMVVGNLAVPQQKVVNTESCTDGQLEQMRGSGQTKARFVSDVIEQ